MGRSEADLEYNIKYYHKVEGTLSDREVFEGLLFCFNKEGAIDYFAEKWFDDDEIKAMIERATNSA
jgi:hypothetical protein